MGSGLRIELLPYLNWPCAYHLHARQCQSRMQVQQSIRAGATGNDDTGQQTSETFPNSKLSEEEVRALAAMLVIASWCYSDISVRQAVDRR